MQKQYNAANMPSTTMDEKAIVELVKEALRIADSARTPLEIKQSLFELAELRTLLDLRSEEQILRYERMRMKKADILDYKQAVHVFRTQLEQAILDLQHKEYLL